MTTRKLAFSVDASVIPVVTAALADEGIYLGPLLARVDGVRCYGAHTRHRLRFHVTNPEDLTRRDLTILFALADGIPQEQIAAMLGVTWSALRGYAKDLYLRLGAKGRCEAIAIAYRMGALNQWEAAT